MNKRCALYRHYDASGALLYVGASANPTRRTWEHRCRTDWASDIARTSIEWFDSRTEARNAERRAIIAEAPSRNIHHINSTDCGDSTVKTLLERCGSRQEILADAQMANPNLDLFAVHRWHQRGSVPGRYWMNIASGAQKRGIKIRVDDFAQAHASKEAAE